MRKFGVHGSVRSVWILGLFVLILMGTNPTRAGQIVEAGSLNMGSVPKRAVCPALLSGLKRFLGTAAGESLVREVPSFMELTSRSGVEHVYSAYHLLVRALKEHPSAVAQKEIGNLLRSEADKIIEARVRGRMGDEQLLAAVWELEIFEPVSAVSDELNLAKQLAASARSGQAIHFVEETARDLGSFSEPDPVGGPAPSPSVDPAKWTVMVFVNGKNNLEKFGLLNINQMEAVGSSDQLKVAVEFGRLGRGGDGNWRGQRRYVIQKDKDTTKITSPVLQEIPKADMGDWNHLVEFTQWAKQAAPSEKTMLIVWNHGSGWDLQNWPPNYRAATTPLGVSYDDETGNHISTPDLGKALAAIGKVDILAFDACLMQMAEVVYQVMQNVEVMVGSEEVEPGEGYNYRTFLAPIAANPLLGPQEVAGVAVKAYVESYAGGKEQVTQSAVRASAMKPLLALLNEWTRLIMAAKESDVVRAARSRVQSFFVKDNIDLLHFVRLVLEKTKNEGVREKGEALAAFLSQAVFANGTQGNTMANASGLAIYFPRGSYNRAYDDLAWAKDGNWASFLKWFLSSR
ncbi:MAG: hypothetical protein HY399_03700 [Elusimicrobia bacterium]|nr:hypothetical protein [Elusimicrobiota bacterium]